MPPRTFAADLGLAVRRPVVRGGARESVVVDLLLDGEGWAESNRQSPVIQGLGEVRFFMTGVLRETGATTPAGPEEPDSEKAAVPAPREPDGMTRTPLIATTRGGSTLDPAKSRSRRDVQSGHAWVATASGDGTARAAGPIPCRKR